MTFAHRLEASSFFQNQNFQAVEGWSKLWKEEKNFLLITGEGQFEALTQITMVLAEFPEIQQVINLGLAGSLGPGLPEEELLTVRTSYLSLEDQAQFKSFPLKVLDSIKKVDCLTSSKRILSQTEREKLSPFAEIVDRELWALAFACHKFNKPLSALKIISDNNESNEFQICELVKEKAKHFSFLLYQGFLKINNADFNQKQIQDPLNLWVNQICHDQSFYFTTSMQRRCFSLLNQLHLKYHDPKKGFDFLLQNYLAPILEELEETAHPKKKAQLFIDKILQQLNPLRTQVEDKLNHLSGPLKSSGWNVKFDHHMEDNFINLSTKVQNKQQLFKLTETLSNFPLDEWQDVFEGE